MKLFLASEAKNPNTLNKLDEYVGGLKKKKIAYIVTAANGEGWGSWRDSATLKKLKSLGLTPSIIQLEDFWDGTKPASLADFDIAWFAGGRPGYLMYWVRRTGFDLNIKDFMEKGGVYVGSSAGSMVTSPSLQIIKWYLDEDERGAELIPGLGLIDFDIYPHYRDELFKEIKKIYKGKKVYLLKDGEALIIDGGRVTVIGEERVIIND